MRDLDLLHKGMTQHQVVRLLGNADHIVSNGPEDWSYSLPGGSLGVEFDSRGHVTRVVRWFECDYPDPPEIWK